MNNAAVGAAEGLLSVMTEITGILDSLLACVREQEKLLASQNIEGLMALREKEEEFISELGRTDGERIEAASAFAHSLGIDGESVRIDQLIDKTDDRAYKTRLLDAKSTMAELVKSISKQNAKNRELLNFHIGYTDYMINMLLVPRSRSNFYNVQGTRNDESGNLNIMDLHI